MSTSKKKSSSRRPKVEAASDKAARPALRRELILSAAVALADREGIAKLTMRKLADSLGVEAMSLYHHVKNKSDMLDGMVDQIFSEIRLPDVDEGWRCAMRNRAISARQVLLSHRWAIGMLDSRKQPGFATLKHHDAVIGSLRRGGFSIAQAASGFSVLDSYIYGFVIQEANLPIESESDVGEMADEIFSRLPKDALPYFTEMVVEHAMKPGYEYGDEFERGLDLILDGLARVRMPPA